MKSIIIAQFAPVQIVIALMHRNKNCQPPGQVWLAENQACLGPITKNNELAVYPNGPLFNSATWGVSFRVGLPLNDLMGWQPKYRGAKSKLQE